MGIKDLIGEEGKELADKARAMVKEKGEEIVGEAKQKLAEDRAGEKGSHG
jgi:hypothetical protein